MTTAGGCGWTVPLPDVGCLEMAPGAAVRPWLVRVATQVCLSFSTTERGASAWTLSVQERPGSSALLVWNPPTALGGYWTWMGQGLTVPGYPRVTACNEQAAGRVQPRAEDTRGKSTPTSDLVCGPHGIQRC